jgi:hypothetical protein
MMKQYLKVILFLLQSFCAVVFSDINAVGDFKTYSSNPDYTCSGTSQVKVSENASGVLGVVHPVCLFDTKCTRNGNANDTHPFLVGCYSVEGQCPDFAVCAKEMVENKDDEIRLFEARLSTTSADIDNVHRYGQNCRYSWGTPASTLRRKIKDKTWTAMCSSPVTGCTMPEALKGSFVATCSGTKWSDEKDGVYLVCPAPQDCLATAIPARPTPTVSEAKALAASGNRKVNPAAVGGNTQKTHMVQTSSATR